MTSAQQGQGAGMWGQPAPSGVLNLARLEAIRQWH